MITGFWVIVPALESSCCGWEVSWESALLAEVAYWRLPISGDFQSQKAQSTLDSGANEGMMGHLVCELLVSSTAPESENESRPPPAPCDLMAPY